MIERKKLIKKLPLTSGFTQAGVQTRLTQSRYHHLLLSSEPYRCPRLREAATTLSVILGQRSAIGKRKNKVK